MPPASAAVVAAGGLAPADRSQYVATTVAAQSSVGRDRRCSDAAYSTKQYESLDASPPCSRV
jgi:hypothetical protein